MKSGSSRQQIRQSAHHRIVLLEQRYLHASRYLAPGHPHLRILLKRIGNARGELRHLMQ